MMADLAERPRLLLSLAVLMQWVYIGGDGSSEYGDCEDTNIKPYVEHEDGDSDGSGGAYRERFSLLVEPEQLEGFETLAVVLSAATRLEELRVTHCEQMLERNMDLIPAIAALPSLRRLRISTFGGRVQEICRTIIAPLVEVDVDASLPSNGAWSSECCGLLDMFNAQRLTLQKMTARFVDLTPEYVDLAEPTIQFPNVHSLRLVNSFLLLAPGALLRVSRLARTRGLRHSSTANKAKRGHVARAG
ncbi:hypothetical protein BV20DRAFT_357828 [Pilatotrama ljubarskyi]|nr:hypothetical protein BV20DRAFT_357828 [Pilatotrama ljubarskyi]